MPFPVGPLHCNISLFFRYLRGLRGSAKPFDIHSTVLFVAKLHALIFLIRVLFVFSQMLLKRIGESEAPCGTPVCIFSRTKIILRKITRNKVKYAIYKHRSN